MKPLGTKFTIITALLLAVHDSPSAVIGTNTPSQAVTSERVAALPRAEQKQWLDYLARSERQWKIDQDFLKAELRELKTNRVIVPPPGRAGSSLPLGRDAKWYSSSEAFSLATNVLTFQTPAGGWSKNLDMSRHPRARGEHFAPDNATRFPSADDNEVPQEFAWNFVGTFDNDATTTQLAFLARVIAALDTKSREPFLTAFNRGVEYIFAAQYPNGGWPQVWPLQHGYHDSITYNDGGMIHVIMLLREVADAKGDFAFVSPDMRRRANVSAERGIACLLRTQVIVNGRRTAWGQQHDALTLQPTSARNYEMPSLASGESGDIVLFLMRIENPSEEMVAAINGAASWFARTPIKDVAFRNVGNEGRRLISEPGSGPLWSRYYQIGTDRPVFGDRDKSIHDDVNEISMERRRGYAWFTDKGTTVIDRFERWKKAQAK